MKQKYISNYGGGNIAPAQYLVELICTNISRKPLPQKFWKQEFWAKIFKQQIAAANNLLKTYDVDILVEAVISAKIKSLWANRLSEILENLKARKNSLQELTISSANEVRKKTSKNNILSKLN